MTLSGTKPRAFTAVLAINYMSQKSYTIGLDIGGSKIAGVLLRRGVVIESSTLATPKDNLEHFLIMAKAVIDPLRQRLEVEKGVLAGIGIGAPGAIDTEKGVVSVSPNLPILNKAKLIDEMRRMFELPDLAMKMDNDANCFVRGEATYGAGRKSKNVFGLTIGTGIGGGWWHDGEIYRGHHGAAAEPGHMIVDFDHLSTLEQAYHKLTQNNPGLMAEEAYRGDILAEKKFSEIGSYLGIALSTIVNLIDPEIIVIGGGFVASSDLFLKAAKENLKKYTFSPAGRSVKLAKSKLGPLAGAIGAGLLIDGA